MRRSGEVKPLDPVCEVNEIAVRDPATLRGLTQFPMTPVLVLRKPLNGNVIEE